MGSFGEQWDVEGFVAVVSAVAAVAGTYFGYVAVRGQLRRRSPNPPGPPAGPEPEPGREIDVFVSHTGADGATARQLAARLRDSGLAVFLAEWVGPGLVTSLEKERALSATANGVLLFSRATMADPEIRDEYAALLQRAHSGGRRFVPVLVEDVPLPPFARIRRPLDLREPGTERFDEQVAALVRACRPAGSQEVSR